MTIPIQINETGISIYSGNLNLKTILEQNIRIAKAFPELSNGWFEEFNARVKAKKFTNERLIASVSNVIDTFKYGHTPNIGHFMDYDIKIPVYSHRQVVNKVFEKEYEWDDFAQVVERKESDIKIHYVLRTDLDKYNLKLISLGQI